MHVLTAHTHTHTHTHIHTLHPRGWGCKKEGVEGCRRLKLLVYAAFMPSATIGVWPSVKSPSIFAQGRANAADIDTDTEGEGGYKVQSGP